MLCGFDEYRIDSHQGRADVNDIGGGPQVNVLAAPNLHLFYDDEASRHGLPGWQYTRYLRLPPAAHVR